MRNARSTAQIMSLTASETYHELTSLCTKDKTHTNHAPAGLLNNPPVHLPNNSHACLPNNALAHLNIDHRHDGTCAHETCEKDKQHEHLG